MSKDVIEALNNGLDSINARFDRMEDMLKTRLEALKQKTCALEVSIDDLVVNHVECSTRTEQRLKSLEKETNKSELSWWKRLALYSGFILVAISGISSAIYSIASTNATVGSMKETIVRLDRNLDRLETKQEKTERDIAVLRREAER